MTQATISKKTQEIIEDILSCTTKQELTDCKSGWDKDEFKQAWGCLSEQEKLKIHDICNPKVVELKKVESKQMTETKATYKTQQSKVKQDKSISELTLAELSLEAEEVFSQIMDGELEEDDLNNVLDQLETKVDATCYVKDFLEAELEAAKARYELIKNKMERQVKYLETCVKNFDNRLLSLHAQGLLKDSNSGNERVIKFRNYPMVDVLVEPEKLPEEFQTIKTTVTPNKTKLKKALKDKPEEVGVIAEMKDNFKVSVGFNRKNKKSKK